MSSRTDRYRDSGRNPYIRVFDDRGAALSDVEPSVDFESMRAFQNQYMQIMIVD